MDEKGHCKASNLKFLEPIMMKAVYRAVEIAKNDWPSNSHDRRWSMLPPQKTDPDSGSD